MAIGSTPICIARRATPATPPIGTVAPVSRSAERRSTRNGRRSPARSSGVTAGGRPNTSPRRGKLTKRGPPSRRRKPARRSAVARYVHPSGSGPLGLDHRMLVFAGVHELAVRLPLPVPIPAPLFPRNVLRENSLHKIGTMLLVIQSLDERHCQALDGKRPHSPRMSETEGKHQKAGVVRHSRHEGLAPVRLSSGLETGSGFFCGRISCRTSDRSACFSASPRAFGLWTPISFSRSSAPRLPSRTNDAQASAILKAAPALHLA